MDLIESDIETPEIVSDRERDELKKSDRREIVHKNPEQRESPAATCWRRPKRPGSSVRASTW